MINYPYRLNEFNEGQVVATPTKVIISSSSLRRKEFIRQLFDGLIEVEYSPPQAEEPPWPNVLSVAHHKVQELLSRYAGNLEKNKGALVISADTRTNVPNNDGQIESKGKPSTPKEVQANFLNIALYAEQNRDNPFYSVTSGSVARILREKSVPCESVESCTVILDYPGVRYLATDEGINRYFQVFLDFYSGPPYSINGLPPVGIKDLSAGLSIPVLTKLGIITQINNTKIYNRDFPQKLRSAIHTAAIGIPSEIFKPFNSEVDYRFQQWNWLNQVTLKSLEREELYV